MLVPRPRVNDSHLDALTKDTPVMQLANARGIMRRIVGSGGGVSDSRKTLDGREGNALVGPCANNAGKAQQAVDVVIVGLNACAREDIGLKVLHDPDIGSQRNIAAGLGRALGTSVSMNILFGVCLSPVGEHGVGKLTAAYSMM